MSAGLATTNSIALGGGRLRTAEDLSESNGLWGSLDGSGEIVASSGADVGDGIITDGGSGVGTLGSLSIGECWGKSGQVLEAGVLVTSDVLGRSVTVASGDTPKARVIRSANAIDQWCLLDVFGDGVANEIP